MFLALVVVLSSLLQQVLAIIRLSIAINIYPSVCANLLQGSTLHAVDQCMVYIGLAFPADVPNRTDGFLKGAFTAIFIVAFVAPFF